MNLPKSEVDRLTRLYSDAQDAILRQLEAAKAKGTSTAHLEAVRKEIQKVLAELDAGGKQWTLEAIPKQYVVGVESVKLPKGVAQADFAGVHTQAAQILADNTYSTLTAVVNSIGRQTDDQLRAYALDAIRGPLMGTSTTQQATSDILTRMVQGGEGVIRTRPDGSTYLGVQVTPGGKWWDMKSYAEMTARTTLADTARAGSMIRMQEVGIELFIVVGGAGEECDACIAAVEGGPYTQAELDSLDGVFHPNCTHDIAADPSALDDINAESA